VQPASTNKEFSILWTCFPIPCFVACSCLQSVLCTPKEFAFQAAGIWELSLGLGTLIPSGGQSQIGDPSRSIQSKPNCNFDRCLYCFVLHFGCYSKDSASLMCAKERIAQHLEIGGLGILCPEKFLRMC
jgi:hypothetical protein